MAEEVRSATGSKLPNSGPFLAKIISHLDPTYMGKLEVQLLREVGNNDSQEGQIHSVKYLSPFAGQTSVEYVAEDPDDYNNTQKSYGMWMIPPDPGNIGIVIFIDGNPKEGYWIGSIQDQGMNFAMPGHAATSFHVDGKAARVPVAEYNKVSQSPNPDTTKIKKPASPLQDILETQGILEDDIRGITTSSARREWPSAVFGISTPGPIDKQSNAKRGPVGKTEHKIPNAFVSRLGGSSFVMDDGDDKFIRKTKAASGPPEYSAIEQGETEGDKTIPHNELIRIRTRTGHQILLHNSEDLIYIGNARGTAWIELTSDGKMDVYCEDSISLRTKQDFNFYADRDFNFEAGRNFNVKIKGKHQMEVGGEKNLIVGSNNTIKVGGKNDTTSGGLFQVKSSGTNVDGGQIHLNSGKFGGTTPNPLSTFENVQNDGSVNSIMLRVPSHEPWPHHENLDPINFKIEKTDRESSSAIPSPVSWKKYSTNTDTFAKIKGSE